MTTDADRSHDPRAQRSRAALRAALVAMLREQPIEQISIVALTARAGVGYATFFRNYADIEAVLSDLSAMLIAELASLVAPAAADGGDRAAAQAISRFAHDRHTALKPLFVGASAALQRDIITRATKTAQAQGHAHHPKLPTELAIAHSVTVIVTVLGWWLAQDDRASEGELAAIVEQLAFAPLGKSVA